MATSTLNKQSGHRNRGRWYFVFGLLIVLGFGILFASLTQKALYVRSVTGTEFSTYVISHHIGHSEVQDDASGFQGDFCVLHLNQPIARNQVASTALNYMNQYQSLDGGSILSIEYVDHVTGKTVKQADVIYNPSEQTVTITLDQGSPKQTIVKHVDWASAGLS